MIAIIAILASILFPVFSQARSKARQTSSISNLRQIGIALAMYRSDYDQVNSRHRFCPDIPDTTCDTAPGPTFTGANEIWWAPYDNSVAPNAPAPYPNYHAGFLQPYIRNTAIFRDPEDLQWQCSYAMSYITGSPMGVSDAAVNNPTAYIVWEHARTPACADVRLPKSPRGAWMPFDGTGSETHYPKRHNGGFDVLRYDGSVKWIKPAALKAADFIATQ